MSRILHVDERASSLIARVLVCSPSILDAGGSFVSGTAGGIQTSVFYDSQSIVNTTGMIVS